MNKRKGTCYYHGRHSQFLLRYHLVLVTKFRKPILTGDVERKTHQYIEETLRKNGCENVLINGKPDHVHVMFDADISADLPAIVNALKTRSSRLVRKEFPAEVSRYYWKPYFWAYSYFVATVGNNAKVVEEYIRNQGG